MRPPLRLTIVAFAVLALLALAAAMQITTRVGEIAVDDRSRAAVADVRRDWPTTGSTIADQPNTDMRLTSLRMSTFALAQGSRDPLDGPMTEATLLALPALANQMQAITAALADPQHTNRIALTDRAARAQLIGTVGFLALEAPAIMRVLPHSVNDQTAAAAHASDAFLRAVRASIVADRLAADRGDLSAAGVRASATLDALEATLLPLLDRRLVRMRAEAVSEIALTAFLVIAVATILLFLTAQALRAQARSLKTREELAYQARHDALTGLPNRRAFADAMETVVTGWTPINDRTTWILSIDLDYFKEVNDRYGHQTGDAFLISAAERLRRATPENDLVARVGGDEFAILVHHYDPDSTYAIDTAQRICDAFREPITVEGVQHRLAASIGMVSVDALHETVDSLLRDADIAMYRAKEDGGDRVVVFDDTLRGAIVHRAELAADLPGALRGNQIGVVFQPILFLGAEPCYGFEALVRWQHPVHGAIPATLLIEVAQEARVIHQLGRYIIHDVCRHLAAWRDAGIALESLSMHFNISPMEAVHDDTFSAIQHALDTYAIPPSTLVVELTETASMDSIDAANRFLSMLHDIDVRICLDDFGTGYSSLRHLNDFHVDAIKIDRSFVVSAADDAAKIPIVAGIIALAQGLNADVIAEGIETSDQQTIIEHLGCRLVQGYLHARPLAPDDALAFARRAIAATA